MKRRSFITTALAGLGAIALLPQIAKPAEPETLTVKDWAEKYRIKEWEPLEVSYMPLPIFPSIVEARVEINHDTNRARTLIRLDEDGPWIYLGATERVTITTKTTRRGNRFSASATPPRLSDRSRECWIYDEPDKIPT